VILAAGLAGMAGLTLPILMMMMARGLRGRRVRVMGRPLAPEAVRGPVPLFVALRSRVVGRARVVRNTAVVLLAP
jgi:hypothetical protein